MEWRGFLHIQVLAHLQLDGVHAVVGLAVVPRDVTTLEAAIEHTAHGGVGGTSLQGRLCNARIGTGTIGRANAQVWQAALKQPGDF